MRSLFNASRLLPLVGLAVVLLAVGVMAKDSDQVVEPEHVTGTPNLESHKTHSPHCEDCHDCEFPTRQDPCLIACPRYESHFFSQKQVEESPDVIIIDQLRDLYQPVVFAHRLHAEMAEMSGGCENCHHYSERDGEIPPCRECHDAERNVVDLSKPALKGAYHRQCMNCHRDWSHENACGFCHAQVTEELLAAAPDSTDIVGILHPMIAATDIYTFETDYAEGPIVTFHHGDHVDKFGQQCVDCHRGDSCASCHDTKGKTQHKLDRLTSCYSCHAERDCHFCHRNEPMPPFEHAVSTGWPLEPYHANKDCKSCHGTPKSFRTPSTTCTSCHIHWEDGAFDHAKVGLVLDDNHIDNDCSDCHVEMDFDTGPTCDNCHDEPMLPDRLPGTRLR